VTEPATRILAAGTTAALDFEAEVAGAAWNIYTGYTLDLVTSIAGVTVSNPSISGSLTWIKRSGVDEELDDRLQERNRTKWHDLSIEITIDGVKQIALKASAGVTRICVDDESPRGAGKVDVYIAGQTGALGTDDVAAVQAALSARFFGSGTALAIAASTTVVNPVGTVYYNPVFTEAQVSSAVRQALTDLLSTVPLGGFDYGVDGLSHIVDQSALIDTIEDVQINGQRAVRTVTLTSGNVSVPDFNVPQLGLLADLSYSAATK
jgi:Baseplate J-like protein